MKIIVRIIVLKIIEDKYCEDYWRLLKIIED